MIGGADDGFFERLKRVLLENSQEDREIANKFRKGFNLIIGDGREPRQITVININKLFIGDRQKPRSDFENS